MFTTKSEVMAAVAAAVAKRALDVRTRLEAVHVERSVIPSRSVNKSGAIVEYTVKHRYGAAGFRTYEDAAGYALACFKAQNPSMYTRDGQDFEREFTDTVMATIDDEQRRANAEASTHTNAGTTAAIDGSDGSNADPALGRERARAKIDRANRNQKRV